MLAFGFLMLYPVLWMIFSSLKPNDDVMHKAAELIPSAWDFSNYGVAWREGVAGFGFWNFMKNSLVISVFSTIGTVISCVLAAYGFERIQFKGRNFWFTCMIMTMMLPAQVVIIPQYMMFQSFGWLNTLLPLIVPAYFGASFGAFSIFLVMQFLGGIPRDLDEAATIDGCGRYGVFLHVLLPLIKPAVATVAIFSFYWKWDDFMGPLLYLNNPKEYTVTLALRMFTDKESNNPWGVAFAMSTLSLIPSFIIFFCFQKYLVEGISTTGLKG